MSVKAISFRLLQSCPSLLLGMLLAVQLPGKAHAEFYSYEDRNGTINFVDDLSKIPAEYRQKKEVRKEEYDDLPEKERTQMLEKQQSERAATKRRENEQQAQARQRRLDEDRRAALEQQREALTTKVVIAGRQVFVPVKLGNGAAETEAMLLLDTGASFSVITPEAAARLKIETADNIRVSVVGGRVLTAKRTILSYMTVGPVKRTEQEVVIVRQRSGEFGDGLLGMSFLGGLKYTIDFEKQTINWIP